MIIDKLLPKKMFTKVVYWEFGLGLKALRFIVC